MKEKQEVSLLRNSLIEKNVTFLFGAGTSVPYFSSLGNFEELLSNTKITEEGKNLIKALFYLQSIKDNHYIQNYMSDKDFNHEKRETMLDVINSYSRFLHNGLEFLKVRNSRVSPKRFNIVTTNYDLFIEAAMDQLLELNPRIYFNDGTNGYGKRILSSDNFNKTLLYAGVFDNYSNEMPTINLIKCHGSVNWKSYKKNGKPARIQVTTEKSLISDVNRVLEEVIEEIQQCFNSDLSLLTDVDSIDELIEKMNTEEPENESLVHDINFISDYVKGLLCNLAKKIEKLQIVLPTKGKFQTTLIEEHYYNMLRLLSYELEKKQSLLVVFGFSFQDEHITEIVQRSLNNPTLLVIVLCFTDNDKESIIQKFNFTSNNEPANLKFITPNTFIIDKVSEEDAKNTDIDNIKYTIIKKDEEIFRYTNVVSTITDRKGNCVPVLDFSSINKILETDIVNKHLPLRGVKSGEINYE